MRETEHPKVQACSRSLAAWPPRVVRLATAGLLSLAVLPAARGQGDLAIYTDSLQNGFQNWGWATLNYANTSPVHSGNASISVSFTGGYQGIQIYHPDMDVSSYSSLSFWINGGATAGRQLQVYALLHVGSSANTGQAAIPLLTNVPANAWVQVTLPLSSLQVANVTNFTGFVIQETSSSAEAAFYLDDLQLNALPPPALVHLSLNTTQTVRTADARWFGLNTAIWDSSLDTPQSISLLTNMGCLALRFPGGSSSDGYHWATDNSPPNTWNWASSVASFAHVATNVGAQAVLTVNYGTGSTNEAAAWVAWANGSSTNIQSLGTDAAGTNWNTVAYWATLRGMAKLAHDDGRNFLRLSRSAPLGFKYWEIGNEVYGTWETDSNNLPNDPYTYAVRARDYISLMKAADPAIRIGVVATPGEDSFANYTTHGAVNRTTGQTHYGWTPVMLATLQSLGVTPDFLIHHRYPQNAGGESDAALLQSSTGWASDAADLRGQIANYFGPAGTNLELVSTENNSVSSGPGKQTTSLVNGLFLADSLGQLMKTEFNGLFWWDLRNGADSNNNNSASLYGWRNYGDYGVLLNLTNCYPAYYVARLLHEFVRPGDSVLSASSDYSLLSAYAARRLNGALTLLVINKTPSNSLPAQVALSGFTPGSPATVFSYGVPQDTAAQTGVGSQDYAVTNLAAVSATFTNTFPPYSVTVLRLSPARPVLKALPAPLSGQVVLQLQGQTGAPYLIQSSTNLTDWTTVSTNLLSTSPLGFTNLGLGPRRFWRAVWVP